MWRCEGCKWSDLHAAGVPSWLWVSVLTLVLSLSSAARAQETLSISVLQFGTAHWELDHVKHAGLDEANGYRLELRTVANLPASHLAVTSGTVNGSVADLLWAQSRYAAGSPYQYLPYSSQIGDVVVAEDSGIDSIADLVGLKIGVAGGPDSKGWVLLNRVAEQQGIDLAANTEVQYGAPPLLSQSLKRGQVDAIVTYWHFAARLKGQGGWRSAFGMEDLLESLGLDPNLPVLGYVFPKAWAEDNSALVAGFARSIRQAKNQLSADSGYWERLKSLMRQPTEGEFAALKRGYVAGIPEPLTYARIDDLHRLLELVGTPSDQMMPADLFFRETP